MFGLAGAAMRQKCRGLLNPLIGEQVWAVNKAAVLEKASAVWQAMSNKERFDNDFSLGSASVLGRLTSAAQKLADKANEERAVIVDSPFVHRMTKPAPLSPEEVDRGWKNKIWSSPDSGSSLEPAFYSGAHGFESSNCRIALACTDWQEAARNGNVHRKEGVSLVTDAKVHALA